MNVPETGLGGFKGAVANLMVSDRRSARLAWICLLGLGGFLAWAGLAPLQQGVTASGAVIVQDKRQVIQHLEGGIVDSILVREGQHVNRGDTLVVLKETASLAGRDQVIKQVAALRARVQRLSALQDDLATPDFSPLDDLEITPEERDDIAGKELSLFNQQRQTIAAELSVLETRRRASVSVGAARSAQADIARRSLTAAQDELGVVRRMADEQLARRDQVSALERSAAGAEGEVARLAGESHEAQAQAGDMAAQAVQVRAQFDRQTALDLVEARNELRASEEQLYAAQDILDRGVITAPMSGEVLNLAVNTRSGVVRPGEPILEIVPTDTSVTASVRVRPTDRASIRVGQEVRTQVLAYRSWMQPRLEGVITSISADLKTDEASGQSYYEATVRVSDRAGDAAAAGAKDGASGIVPGMPVQVFIYSGFRRTMLDYLLEPVFASVFRGLRST